MDNELRWIYNKLISQAKKNNLNIDEEKIRQQAWINRDRMLFERNFMNTSSSSAAGSSGGRRARKIEYEFSTSQNIIFIYSDNDLLKFVIYDFTNYQLNGPTIIGNYQYSGITPIHESGYLVRVSDPLTETNINLLINPLAQIVKQFDNMDNRYVLEGGGMVIDNTEDGVKKIYIYRKERLLAFDLDKTTDYFSRLSFYDTHSKNGFYYEIVDSTNDNLNVYYLDDESDTSIYLFSNTINNYILYQHKNLDNCVVNLVVGGIYYLRLYNRGVLVSEFNLTDYEITFVESIRFLNSNGDFLVLGSSAAYFIYYNSTNGFSINQYGPISFVSNYNKSYLNSYSSENSSEYYSTLVIDNVNYSGDFVVSDSPITINYYMKETGFYEQILGTGVGVISDYVINDGKISYITREDGLYGLITYDGATISTFGITISGTVSSTYTESLRDRFVFTYILESDDTTYNTNIINDTGIHVGPTMLSTGFNVRSNGGCAILYDNSNVYYTNYGSTYSFVSVGNYYNSISIDSFYLPSGYIEETSYLLKSNNDSPYVYGVLTDNTFFDGLIPFYEYADFSKGDVYLSKDYLISVQNIITFDIHYFSDYGVDNYSISDGGRDMYDSGNIISTSYGDAINIPYTHTQALGESDGLGPDLSNYTMNGTVSSGELYFGPSSSYFTNLYPGLFVMVADGVNGVDSFKIDGDIGADGDGNVSVLNFYVNPQGDVETWGSSPSNIQYAVFVKKVHSSSDPSVNHIIIMDNPLSPESYLHNYDETLQDDLDQIIMGSSPTKISYLLFSVTNGGQITDENIYLITKKYIELTDGLSISNVLTNIGASYSEITDIFDVDLSTSVSVNIYDKYTGTSIYSDNLEGTLDEIYIVGERVSITTIRDNVDTGLVYVFNGSEMVRILENNYVDNRGMFDDYLYWDD
jgi:hypothetical protein